MKIKFTKSGLLMMSVILVSFIVTQCTNTSTSKSGDYKILFLHHSTGESIWKGSSNSIAIKGMRLGAQYDVPKWFDNYNKNYKTAYQISEQIFPKQESYGWENYPFDYYNIWVKNAGDKAYKGEPTLEMLTKEYNMIIFKHCFPVGDFAQGDTTADINSPEKTIENYKLQYDALKQKLLQFPNTKFLIWTGAVRVQPKISESNALLSQSFFEWVRATWDTENDNIFLWDFYELETDGGLYMKPEYATDPENSHPNKEFAGKVAPLFCQRITDIIENDGKKTSLTGVLNNKD